MARLTEDEGDVRATESAGPTERHIKGHLFVVHGKIECLIHDAVILPVGSEFVFNPVWTELVGPRPEKPRDWDSRGWGGVPNAPERVRAVSVGGRFPDDYGVILSRIEAALRRISERRTAHSRGRGSGTLPLVALPVIGIGLGGYSGERGRIVRLLVERLHKLAIELDLDVAIVTPEASVYAAAQYARRHLPSPLGEDLEDASRDLGKKALKGQLALFLGAGISAAAGLPTWHQLISRLAADFDVAHLVGHETGLTVTDQAELIEAAAGSAFKDRVIEIAGDGVRPSLLHALLAGLDSREVVTTNYDLLFEEAVAATNRRIVSVMPWESAHDAQRWVLKLHGDVKNRDSIVLTRRHMVRFDAANRPSAAVLQSLLLTKRLLIVGTSMTDDNVIRLAHEVQAYRDHYQRGGSGTFGTVLDVDGNTVRGQLWKGQLDWIDLPGELACAGHRGVELLLDRVAFHAARDSSWLLDRRFEGLLDSDHDRELADQVRDVYRQILDHSDRTRMHADGPGLEGTKWWPLVQRLRELGVDGRDL